MQRAFDLGVQVAMGSPGALVGLSKNQHTPLLEAFRKRDNAAAALALQADLQMGTDVEGYWEAIERAIGPRVTSLTSIGQRTRLRVILGRGH